MSDHPYALAPQSKKPYIGISYYSFQEWVALIDQDKLTRWEQLRFKLMHERYAIGRGFLQIPVMAVSWWAAQMVWGNPIRRRDAGFRDNFVFATFFYIIFHHFIDQIRAKDRFLDELFTQADPDGSYIRTVTKHHYPELWEDIKEQLLRKGVQFSEPPPYRYNDKPMNLKELFKGSS